MVRLFAPRLLLDCSLRSRVSMYSLSVSLTDRRLFGLYIFKYADVVQSSRVGVSSVLHNSTTDDYASLSDPWVKSNVSWAAFVLVDSHQI